MVIWSSSKGWKWRYNEELYDKKVRKGKDWRKEETEVLGE